MSSSDFPHLFEILKLVEAATTGDRTAGAAYASQLAEKLDRDGQDRAASRIRRALRGARQPEITAAKLEHRTKRPPVDTESRFSLADVEHVTQEEADIVLQPSADAVLEEFIKFVEGAERLEAHGVGVSPSLLVYGPPGCGKTQLARHLAHRLHLPLVTGRTDALISSFLGNTAKNLRALFEHAAAHPCVLFLDEFDAVAKLRDDRQELGELKRVVVSLLQNIDALDPGTVVIAATNHEHLLDPAVWRRFSFKLHLEAPALEARVALFAKFLRGFAVDGDLRRFGAASEGLTGADIRQLCDDSVRRAVLADEGVSETDVLMRIARVRLRDHAATEKPLGVRLNETKQLAPKVFTNRRLAAMFGISVGHVSNLLRKEACAHA